MFYFMFEVFFYWSVVVLFSYLAILEEKKDRTETKVYCDSGYNMWNMDFSDPGFLLFQGDKCLSAWLRKIQ